MNLKILAKNFWWFLTASNTINKLPDSVISIDKNGIIQHVNAKACECFGLSNKSEKVVNIDKIIKDGMAVIKSSVRTQNPVTAFATIPGRDFHIELNAIERKFGYLLTIRDLTALTNEIVTEEKIARLNGEKNALLVKLEDEFKSPVVSIKGFSQGLLDGLGGELTDKQAKYIKIIKSNSNDLHDFVENFLDFTQAESSLYEPEYKKFDIVDVFRTVIKDFEPEIEAKNLAFDYDHSNIEKRTIYSDIKAVQKILRNIMEVSVSLTESGYIMARLSRPDEDASAMVRLLPEDAAKAYLQITIKDSGVGFTPEEKRFVSDPYAQFDKGKKNFLRSLKLGTASILTKRTNGHITIASDVMNGTRYDVIIPIEKGADE
ncbi:PAS domain-containing protein [bacterium]|nr:PAS domain-containing protein [bacterium]